MRVRQLQTYLQDTNLIQQSKLNELQGTRIGIDAVHWLRTIQGVKDPFGDALGGIPPGAFGFVDKELQYFSKLKMQPMFVFQGMTPAPQHQMFQVAQHEQMDNAWVHLARGDKNSAQKCFAVSTSRINSDVVYFIFQHLQQQGWECFQAPYFAGTQLAHFAEKGVLEAVFGPPGHLLYGVQKVIISIDFPRNQFDWVELDSVLAHWQLSREQFVDACMMAGTEHCLTYPYLNLESFSPSPGRQTSFGGAVDCIRQAPLINWMQTFPTTEMREDHMDGYCVCRVLVHHSPVLNLQTFKVQPVSAPQGQSCPSDYADIMGAPLPNAVYLLMSKGILSSKLPSVLATKIWHDKSLPHVDTLEYRDVLKSELVDIRARALGLLAKRMHPSFAAQEIRCRSYFEHKQGQRGAPQRADESVRSLKVNCDDMLCWRFSERELEMEMRRQGATEVDFAFCLKWHKQQFETGGSLFHNLTKATQPAKPTQKHMLSALVHFMVLESLQYFSPEGDMTYQGDVLSDTPREFQEPILTAFQMLGFGVLDGEPYTAIDNRQFPAEINYPTPDNVDDQQRAQMLLCRLMGLVPMSLKNDMWNAEVDFDLAAFHSIVRILKRALRQLTEACLAGVLLPDMKGVMHLPNGFMSPLFSADKNSYVLPPFFLPRACMGIVVKFFLNHTPSARGFEADVKKQFPCCSNPVQDLHKAIRFWHEMKRCVDQMASNMPQWAEFAQDMHNASVLLQHRERELRLV
mmetsp:Transcript_51009/g.134396  ORF Transcript_51009/g.134396 Transcript_51009/m.134396 type:complete len:742 (+) Transcript_51009:39-2264(+)